MNASHADEFSFRTFTYSTDPEGRDLVGQWYGMSLVEKVHQREPLMAYLGKDGQQKTYQRRGRPREIQTLIFVLNTDLYLHVACG